MSPAVEDSSVALTHDLRAFLKAPTHEGLFVHCKQEGVDLVVQVLGEARASLAANCGDCDHRNRFQHAPKDADAECSLCGATLPALSPAEPDEKYHAFTWRVAWAKDGHEGLGMGATIDEGEFTDADLLKGIGDMHACLRVFLPLFDALNVTNMEDYRALTQLRGPRQVPVEVGEA